MRNPSEAAVRRLRAVVLTTLVALVAEFVLGMIANLYAQFPNTTTNGDAWNWSMSHSPVVLSHVILGAALVLLALTAIVLSIVVRRASGIVYSCLGFALILSAWQAGVAFLTHGQQNGSSLGMAIGFIGAAVVYAIAYHRVRYSVKLS